MSDFGRCMAFVRPWEGGFVDDPKDPGGATRYGISLRFLRGVALDLGDVDGDGDIDANDILSLTQAQAENLYRVKFWDSLDLDGLPQVWRLPVFDAAVNMGTARAVKVCQETICDLGPPVVVDGILGPITRESAKVVAAYREREICDRYCLHRLSHYSKIVAANGDLARFLRGWINRVVSLADNEKRRTKK